MPEPKSPVVCGLEHFEIVIAKDQPQYMPLPTLRSHNGNLCISRWELSAEERRQIAEGADVFLTVWTGGMLLQPVKIHIGRKEDGADILEDLGLTVLPEKHDFLAKAYPLADYCTVCNKHKEQHG